MKPRHVSLLTRAGVLALLAVVALAMGVLVFQCLYWLRFASWFDWTDPDGPSFPGHGWPNGSWKGAQATFDLFLSAPVQLSASIAGLILIAIYIWVRTLSRR